ncbi:hypothetical protein BJF78_12200 [Pseudonocardia sp. CNS-139]|nr:hypothetical protein BJF78_12200 [Pseudonocardia sp. CNS-139]
MVRRYLRWLGRLYPPGRQALGSTAPNSLRPDRLGEDHVALTVLEQPELVRGLADRLAPEHRDRAMLVLGRAAARHPGLVDRIADLIDGHPAEMVRTALVVAGQLERPGPVIEAVTLAVRRYGSVVPASSVVGLIPPTAEFAELLVLTAQRALSSAHLGGGPDHWTIALVAERLALAHSVLGEDAEALRASGMALRAHAFLDGSDLPDGRARALVLHARLLGRAGRRAEGRAAAAEAVELLRARLHSDPDAAVTSSRTADRSAEEQLVGSLEAYQELADSAGDPSAEEALYADLLDRLQRIAVLRQRDELLTWMMERALDSSGQIVPLPPDLAIEMASPDAPAPAATVEELRAARVRIADQINLLLELPKLEQTPTPVEDVVAALTAAGLYRWHTEQAGKKSQLADDVPLTVIAVTDGRHDLRALYHDPESTCWILDTLELDAYGGFARVDRFGQLLAAGSAAPDAIVAALRAALEPPGAGFGTLS